MRKFIKLLKNPKKFFLDSLWFKSHEFNIMETYDHVFIVSHLGQLTQVEAFIKSKNINNTLLIILYTNRNRRIPKAIHNTANRHLINKIIFFQLPNYPNNYSIKSLLFMKRNYKKLLEEANPRKLYLLSFENHYSLLANIAKDKKIHISLLEEGTATYKNQELSEYNQSQLFIKNLLAKILGVYSAYNVFKNFNTIYAAFPKLLKEKFNADKYHYFFAYEHIELNNQIQYLIDKYNITNQDYIYVNQRYNIDAHEFVSIILNILSKINYKVNANIFIKLHPKDSNLLKDIFKKELEKYQQLILIDDNEFSIELIIKRIKPRGIIGISSTTLVYTPLISNKTKSYTIKTLLVNSLLHKNKYHKTIKLIEQHYKVLKQFKHIKELSN
jgi:hypothetical protein